MLFYRNNVQWLGWQTVGQFQEKNNLQFTYSNKRGFPYYYESTISVLLTSSFIEHPMIIIITKENCKSYKTLILVPRYLNITHTHTHCNHKNLPYKVLIHVPSYNFYQNRYTCTLYNTKPSRPQHHALLIISHTHIIIIILLLLYKHWKSRMFGKMSYQCKLAIIATQCCAGMHHRGIN